MSLSKIYCGELLWHISSMTDDQWLKRNADRADITQALLLFHTDNACNPIRDANNHTAVKLWRRYQELRIQGSSDKESRIIAFNQALDEVMPVMKRRKIIYLCSPYSGNVEQNIKNACIAAKEAILVDNVAPIIPHLMYPVILDDDIPEERALGIDLDIDLISKCDELWYYGDTISAGMRAEIDFAQANQIPVIAKPWPDTIEV